MKIQALLDKEVQDFINRNIDQQVTQLALQKKQFNGIALSEVVQQVAAKQKAEKKLPTWFATANIIYPSKVSVEQTSSEQTAAYKASLISGKTLLDATGGFGVDDYYFAQQFQKVIHCEWNQELSEIVKHNAELLKVNNLECLSGDSTEIIKKRDQQLDWIYIDPSRRHDHKGKVFMLKDCEPNVPDLLEFYFQYTSNILIKTAPLLDLKAGLSELKYVKKIHIIALDNEVKELLWEIHRNYEGDLSISAVTIEKGKPLKSEFNWNTNYQSTFSKPKKYLFEPNAALLKSGMFDAVSAVFHIDKLHQHSHLYTTDEDLNLPGRNFIIDQVVPFDKNSAKTYLLNQKLNISTRNFPLKPEELRKKYKIKDGGDTYVFFTTNSENKKIILFCTKK
ncbi:class I SAM-dependent methyltransferase [Flavobacterium sp. NRK F10]|uniref:class I SAM-dependent methyltransferase n=1 Tax=Flavobacterium sp. NRK F10 TaxID=2954931 RepID=UPI002091E320|nr:class I SAM-dependent methyltransferase [Flavobacterium sp. NRK F10]MCO6176171.1 class I SAM-dependent methyltransferase [Flavobacterium sp. NRK F10]